MIDALIAGERDAEILAGHAIGGSTRRTRSSNVHWLEVSTAHHGRLARWHLDHIDETHSHDRGPRRADRHRHRRADAAIRDRLITIPVSERMTAEVIIAEIGHRMSVFPPQRISRMGRRVPGNNESGRPQTRRPHRTRSPWLIDVLVQPRGPRHTPHNTYLNAQFWRLARRIGKKKAAVAVRIPSSSPCGTCSHNVDYHDLGADYFDRRESTEHETRRLPPTPQSTRPHRHHRTRA